MPAMIASNIRHAALAVFIIVCASSPAMAYVGPGAGMGLISSFLALAAVIGLSLAMTLLYPLRALYRKFRGGAQEDPGSPAAPAQDKVEDKAPKP